VRNIWLDVEDLFEYAASNPRPSGIQRLTYEIYRALQQGHGECGRIHFVRHNPIGQTFRVVPWVAVAHLFDRLADAPKRGPAAAARRTAADRAGTVGPGSRFRRMARRLVYCLPLSVRHRFLVAARLQLQASLAIAALVVFSAGRLLVAVQRWVGCHLPSGIGPGPSAAAGDFAAMVRPGDFLVVLGAPWTNLDYAGLVRNAKNRFGLLLAVLVFDLIPVRRPEWCDRGLVRAFRNWYASTLPEADIVLAISRWTADDVERFAADSGFPLRSRPEVIPIGSGFGAMQRAPAVASDPLPPSSSYALFVSTIEPRKNHLLLFRVWRRMLDEMPAARVPTLVFAGRVGWLVGDLMTQLANTDYLNGKIRLIEDASDAELASLYRDCQFTLFPSLYEGWGLPVTESLLFGKPCLAARATALPEAGGRFARYFDPESVSDAYGLIRSVVEDPDGLRAWQAEIVRDFAPVPWTATSEAILRILGIG
jgi:glycosyltransferase involved in cell wall biosynthesis